MGQWSAGLWALQVGQWSAGLRALSVGLWVAGLWPLLVGLWAAGLWPLLAGLWLAGLWALLDGPRAAGQWALLEGQWPRAAHRLQDREARATTCQPVAMLVTQELGLQALEVIVDNQETGPHLLVEPQQEDSALLW